MGLAGARASELDPDQRELFGYENTEQIRAEMAALMPLYQGVELLKKEGDSVQWGGTRLGVTDFATSDGRAHFSVIPIPKVDVPEGRFFLTLRRGMQFNSMTFGDKDPLKDGSRRDTILLDERDLDALGIREGERVLVRSDTSSLTAVARVVGKGPRLPATSWISSAQAPCAQWPLGAPSRVCCAIPERSRAPPYLGVPESTSVC